MKKFNWNFLLLCVAFCAFCLTACDNDDDEGSAGQIGVLDHNSNVRISSLSYGYKNKNFYYSYGDDGRLKSIIYTDNGDRDELRFSYGPDKINDVIDVKYTKEGYISSLIMGSNTYARFSYDKNGQLTQIKDGSRTYTLEWKNKLLMKFTFKTTYANGDYDLLEETYNYDGEELTSNYHHQYTPSISPFDNVAYEAFAYVGLLGKGPLHLPSSAEDLEEFYEKAESKKYSYPGHLDYSYVLNDDKSVNIVYANRSSYNFSYETIFGTE